VRQVLIAHLGIDPDRLQAGARLEQDIGLDSIALTEALLILEDELAISIPDPVQATLRTIDDLIAVVATQLTRTASSESQAPQPRPPLL
ncbi:MAG: acyl carrier protein, partial [Acidimicrobiales bacterium]